jgi:hypothetical protein
MKRLVQVASEKGGVGKSHLTANLAQYYFDHGVAGVRLFDPDYTNSTLLRFHPGTAEFVDVKKPQSMDQIVDAFGEGATTVLVDGIGGQKGVFLDWIDDIGLLDLAQGIGLGVTFVLVVDEDKDTVHQSGHTIRTVGGRVDWLIAKNHKTVSHTDMWDRSEARAEALRFGAREIVLEKLPEHLISRLQMTNQTIARAGEDAERFSLWDRQRLKKYARALYAQFDEQRDILLGDEAWAAAEPGGGT